MKRIRICIIGAGNISNTRHIPALMKSSLFEIIGVVSNDVEKINKIRGKFKIQNYYLIEKENAFNRLALCDWFINDVDAVVIGTPPHSHFSLVMSSLQHNKHVLVEKPMMMNVEECDAALELAEKNGLVFYVMHNFQYADGFRKLQKLLSDEKLGCIKSILEVQFSNRSRRLPSWYNDLPLGLFYDEAAHFFYTARKLGGPLRVIHSFAQLNENENTPVYLSAQLMAGLVPVQMYMNFCSPVCEWMLIVFCEDKIAYYDFFKDILVVADNDRQHLPMDVLRTNFRYTFGFWKGFISNGFKMVMNRLLYGHDAVMRSFAKAILTGDSDEELTAAAGRAIVEAMNEVVHYAEKRE